MGVLGLGGGISSEGGMGGGARLFGGVGVGGVGGVGKLGEAPISGTGKRSLALVKRDGSGLAGLGGRSHVPDPERRRVGDCAVDAEAAPTMGDPNMSVFTDVGGVDAGRTGTGVGGGGGV